MFGYTIVKKEDICDRINELKASRDVYKLQKEENEHDAELYQLMKRNIEHCVKSIFTGRAMTKKETKPYLELMKMLKEYGVFE